MASPGIAELIERHPRALVVEAVRAALAGRRARRSGPGGLAEEVTASLRPSLRRAINATGVILHTNLGRAPLAEEAVAAVAEAAGACTLEWDPEEGGRGSRHVHVEGHLRALTGAEAACATGTNAGAVLLALVASASGGEVVVSRGQLVEIGGGFRIPEVLAASGCRLVEVGTTNRTRLGDYERAIGPETAALLRVHPSNFRVVGFSEEVPLPELAALAGSRGLTLIDDAGSGALTPAGDPRPWADEPDVRASVAAGADLVCFSADKLLGGPQAGLIVGTADAVGRARSHPLMRALRPGKLALAALEATLRLHREPALARRRLPALRMLAATPEELHARAAALATATGGEVVATTGRVGGGALPLAELPSFAVALDDSRGPDALAAALRAGTPPVAALIRDGRVMLDVLAVEERDIPELRALVAQARR